MSTALKKELKNVLQGRAVVVGVGDERRGDDAVGPMIAGLLSRTGVRDVLDAGVSPELETWRIRDLMPTTVLFVDAVDFGGKPGDVSLLSPSEMRSEGFDTHRAPLRLTMRYLENELGCACRLLAVQPKDAGQGTSMCDEVRRSAEGLALMMAEVLNRQRTWVVDGA